MSKPAQLKPSKEQVIEAHLVALSAEGGEPGWDADAIEAACEMAWNLTFTFSEELWDTYVWSGDHSVVLDILQHPENWEDGVKVK